MAILAQTRLKDVLREHPELKEKLIALSPKFQRLNNPMVYRLVSRWATLADVARIGGLSVCELLHELNREIGTEEQLMELAPECIEEKTGPTAGDLREKPSWVNKARQVVVVDVQEEERFFLPEIISALGRLQNEQILLVTTTFQPAPLLRMLREEGHEFFYEQTHLLEHRLYVRNKTIAAGDWREHRRMRGDALYSRDREDDKGV